MAIEVGHGPGGLFSDGSGLNAKATGSTTLRTLGARFADVVNVKDFGASGSAQTTTGSISSGSNQLTVASAIDFAVGQGISVADAGPASALLVTSITAINGLVFTLATTAGTNASNKAVKHDDTVSIQVALSYPAYPGGPTFVPPGTYRVSSSLTLQDGTILFGTGYNGFSGPGPIATVTIIDATAVSGSVHVLNKGIEIRNLFIDAPTTATSAIHMTGRQNRITNVVVNGAQHGIYLDQAIQAFLTQVWSDISDTNSFYIHGGWGHTLIDCVPANAETSLRIDGGAYSVNVFGGVIDESFGAGNSTVLVLDADRILLQGMKVFYSHGGYGIRLGDGATNPTRVTVRDVTVERFAAGVAATNGLEIRGSGHLIENVIVDVAADGSATGVSDLASDTRMYGVTDITNGGTTYIALKDPNLPTASPGAGSKQLWYDAADGNRVKFAP